MKQTILLIFILTFVQSAFAQPKWKRGETALPPLSLFHSTHVSVLPTAETPQKGDVEFEISHRFNTPVSEGIGELYGFDGSVTMRIALGYAITDNIFAVLGRSNYDGNIDFKIKYKAIEFRHDVWPLLIAVQAGGAYNGKADRAIEKSQFYGQMIFNTLLYKKIGIGVVPSYLYNSHIFCDDNHYSFNLGSYLQYYVHDQWNLFVEVNPTVTGWRDQFNSVSFGIELETGGHFFKILLSNNIFINQSQFLAGALHKWDSGDLHFGFNITRLLK